MGFIRITFRLSILPGDGGKGRIARAPRAPSGAVALAPHVHPQGHRPYVPSKNAEKD